MAPGGGRRPLQLLVPEGRGAARRLPQRQLGPRADGPLRHGQARRWSSPPDQLVPLPRARITPVPALPEPPVDHHRCGRGPHRIGPGLHLEPVSAGVPVAGDGLPGGPRPTLRPVDGVGRRADVPVHRQHHRCRFRDQGIRVDRIRCLDPVVGHGYPSPGLGILLAGHQRGAEVPACHRLGVPDRDAPFRNGLPGARPHRALPVPHAVRAEAPGDQGAGRGRGDAGRHRLGDHSPALFGPVGLRQRDPPWDRARERLRRPPRPRVAGLRSAPGRGPPPRPDAASRHRARGLPGPVPPGRARACPSRPARDEPAPLVRPYDVRVAGRGDPGQHRHLHEAFHVGHPAGRVVPGRGRGHHRVRRRALPHPPVAEPRVGARRDRDVGTTVERGRRRPPGRSGLGPGVDPTGSRRSAQCRGHQRSASRRRPPGGGHGAHPGPDPQIR